MDGRTIRSVLNVRKPAFWILITVIATLILAVCTVPRILPKKLTVIDSGSAIDGISVSLKEAKLDVDPPCLVVEWKNERGGTYAFGEAFDIVYWNGFDWERCATTDLFFASVGHSLYYETDMTYDLEYFDLSRPGRYRIYMDDVKNESLWIEFELSVTM